MCKKPEEALRFLALRFIEKVVVFEINIPKDQKNKVQESFDHNQNFFKCRAWMYTDNVPKEWIKVYNEYQRRD